MASPSRVWSGTQVLVTGGGGFIGSHLVERLVAVGARTRALIRYTSSGRAGWLEGSAVRSDIELVAGDIGDPDVVARAAEGADVIFHLAALIGIPYSYVAPRAYVHTNVIGTLNVLQSALRRGATVVHTSTSEVYGSARYVPIDEAHPLQAQSPYAASKVAADKLVESFHHAYGLPVVTVRPFNTYGPRQSSRAVIPTIITQALVGEEVRLGNTDPRRDLVFVSDTVDGFVRAGAAQAAIGLDMNLGTGSDISIGELATLIGRVMGMDLRIERDEARIRPSGSEVDRLCASPARAREILGWTPAVGLEEGLRATVEWYRQNSDRVRAGEYAV